MGTNYLESWDYFFRFDGDERDVVHLRALAGELAEFLLHAGEHGLGTERGGHAENLGHAFHAEFLFMGIERLAHAVGVEQHAIAGLQLDFLILGDPLENRAASMPRARPGERRSSTLPVSRRNSSGGIVAGAGDDEFAVGSSRMP